jgi:putative PEP-CTERM system histidine kinase
MSGLELFWINESIFLTYLGFSIALALRSAWAPLAKFFFAAMLVTAAWAQISALGLYGFVPVVLYRLATTTRDAIWLFLCLGLLRPRMKETNYWKAILCLVTLLVAAELGFETGFIPEPMVAGVYLDATLTRVLSCLLCAFLVENILRNASRGQLWALKHWAIGLFLIVISELVYRVPEFLTHLPATELEIASPVVFLIALPFLVVSFARLPQVNLKVHSSRAFIFHTATVIAAGVLLLAVAFAAWYVRSYGGSQATALETVVLFGGCAAIATILVSSSLRSRLRRFIDENFFSLKYDYRLEWEKVIRSLSLDPDRPIGQRALGVLCDLMDSPGGAVWFWRDSWKQFVPYGQIGITRDPVPIAGECPSVDYLRTFPNSFIDLDETQSSFEAEQRKPVLPLATTIDRAWIIVPLHRQSELVGFAVLQQPRAPKKLGWEEQNLLRVVALQISSHFVQEETAQSLADARQLEDFNRRFAFIVHDVKNTIGQLRLLVENIARYGGQQEFQDDMAITLVNAVERLEFLLKSLATVGSSVPGRNIQDIDLVGFLRDYVRDRQRAGQNVLFRQPSADTSIIKTDSTILRTVVDHVFSNAVEASDGDGAVELGLEPAGDMISITITDKGRGMTEQFIRDELFRILRTNKQGGFGIGAYQMRQLMRDLGGDVKVSSAVGAGTCVALCLPCHSSVGAT